jgi:hypothetical protein
VISYENSGKAWSWSAISLPQLMKNVNEWNLVTITEEVKSPQNKDDILKIVFWNDHETPIEVDNIVVKLLN